MPHEWGSFNYEWGGQQLHMQFAFFVPTLAHLCAVFSMLHFDNLMNGRVLQANLFTWSRLAI